MPKRVHSPGRNLGNSKRVKRQTVYHVIRNEAYDGPSSSGASIQGTYETLKEANSAARKDLLNEWSRDVFEEYEEELDDEGKVSIQATFPEGEAMYVYVEEKKIALEVKPVFLVMKRDSESASAGTRTRGATDVESVHVSIASANLRIKELAEELRSEYGKLGKEGAIEVVEKDQGLLVAQFNNKDATKARDVVFAQKMELTDLALGGNEPDEDEDEEKWQV